MFLLLVVVQRVGYVVHRSSPDAAKVRYLAIVQIVVYMLIEQPEVFWLLITNHRAKRKGFL